MLTLLGFSYVQKQYKISGSEKIGPYMYFMRHTCSTAPSCRAIISQSTWQQLNEFDKVHSEQHSSEES